MTSTTIRVASLTISNSIAMYAVITVIDSIVLKRS